MQLILVGRESGSRGESNAVLRMSKIATAGVEAADEAKIC